MFEDIEPTANCATEFGFGSSGFVYPSVAWACSSNQWDCVDRYEHWKTSKHQALVAYSVPSMSWQSVPCCCCSQIRECHHKFLIVGFVGFHLWAAASSLACRWSSISGACFSSVLQPTVWGLGQSWTRFGSSKLCLYLEDRCPYFWFLCLNCVAR